MKIYIIEDSKICSKLLKKIIEKIIKNNKEILVFQNKIELQRL